MKKMIAIALAALLIALSASALAAAPAVETIEYEGNGFIEIDFLRDVRYDNLNVRVTDLFGTELPVTIYERDDDDLTFRTDSLIGGAEYRIIVTGVSDRASGDSAEISQTIAIPESGVAAIQKVEYDRGDRELDIEFIGQVTYSNPTIEVTDLNGNVYDSSIVELNDDGIEARVSGLTYGDTYLVRVTGVSERGAENYLTAAMEFAAVDD